VNQHILPPIRGDSREIDALAVRDRRRRRSRDLWSAVARLTRQVLAFDVGDRRRQRLRSLWRRVPPADRRRLIAADAYEVYAAFFRPWQYRPRPQGSGRTSVAEGPNYTWRDRPAGLVRRTVYTRDEADLRRRLLLVVDQHNRLCRHRIEHVGGHKLST
jgi:IS1 family transposase